MQPDSNNSIELERTFLAKAIPQELRSSLPERVVDVYMPDDLNTHPQLRVRRRGQKYEITKKTPIEGDVSHMLEQTIPLGSAEFASLITGHSRLVEKDRYKVYINTFEAEVDVFSGPLEGLVLIDFEFPSKEAKDAFVPPAVCLAEVTQEDFIAGGLLAGRAYADIAKDLARFNYQPLHVA
jgi:CYTH domain-containing protein